MFRLTLVDTNADLVAAWQTTFRGLSVAIEQGDILQLAENTLVSPANSLGIMDGGIDAAYTEYFGLALSAHVQEAISRRPEGLLPVGAAILLRTGHRRIPLLISAPTMELPGPVPATNAYRAMRAVLRTAAGAPGLVTHVYCPGLATGVGHVEPTDAAEAMARAFEDWSRSSDAC
jgi:O-acetyl-ADP-ribose deacetylase (regulator of RNase III)